MQCARCDRTLSEDDRFCARCGLARSEDGVPVDPLIGLTVSDRYRIEERIGVGGMGTVYRAQHIRFGQDVAIKVLHERYTGDMKLAQRFEKEALTYGQVSHPNLVGLHDFGTTPDGMFFMALEYCPGESLSTLLRQNGRFHWRAASDIVMQIAQGLGAAHDCGVVHRDLKPENIIMTEMRPHKYHARLLDFGIAKREDEEGPRLTQAGMVFGTPEYMSPEQARGKMVDKRSDIYALGTLFYELIVGHPPFHGGDKLRVMQQQANEIPIPPSEQEIGEVPEAVEALILKCLEKEPSSRFQNTQTLLDQLEASVSMTGSDIVDASVIRGSWRNSEGVNTSSLGQTLVGDTAHGLAMDQDENDTREQSPLAEGFYHRRITTQARAYLPVMGAAATILFIVIGGGLLVRGQQEHQANLSEPVTRGINQVSHLSNPVAAPKDVKTQSSPAASQVTREATIHAKSSVPNPLPMTQKRGDILPKRSSVVVATPKSQPTSALTTRPSENNIAVQAASVFEKRFIHLEEAIKIKSLSQAKTKVEEITTLSVKTPLSESETLNFSRLKKAVSTLEIEREKEIERLVEKGKSRLKSADFNHVEASIEKLRSLKAPEDRYKRLEANLKTARDALTKARAYYAQADCRGTLRTLEPIMNVSPESKRVAKLVSACRRALPPQKL